MVHECWFILNKYICSIVVYKSQWKVVFYFCQNEECLVGSRVARVSGTRESIKPMSNTNIKTLAKIMIYRNKVAIKIFLYIKNVKLCICYVVCKPEGQSFVWKDGNEVSSCSNLYKSILYYLNWINNKGN